MGKSKKKTSKKTAPSQEEQNEAPEQDTQEESGSNLDESSQEDQNQAPEEAQKEFEGKAVRDFYYEGKMVRRDESVLEGDKKLSEEAVNFLVGKGLVH